MQSLMQESIVESGESGALDFNQIMAKLDQYRKQSEELVLMNELHTRLAGAFDLQGMIEAFSVWLMPLVDHEVVAYHHPDKDCSQVICSCHGPERRRVLQLAQKFFRQPKKDDCLDCATLEGFKVTCWNMPRAETGLLVLLQKGTEIDQNKKELMDGAVAVMEGPLKRAVYYEELVEQATKDSLTGLANRRVYEDRIDSFLERAKRNKQPMTMASLDLDNFKKINDSLGHAQGDRVLAEVAMLLSETVRASDLLVRMGGDEFVVVLPNTDLSAAQKLANRICKAVRKLGFRTPNGEQLGISIGLAQWNPRLSSAEWLQRADEVLYQAKADGRNRVCVEKPIAVSTTESTEH